MTLRVFIHVGPHKTGSTFLQAVLRRNKQALAAEGVLFAGRRYSVQRQAVQDLLRGSSRTSDDGRASRWDALASEVLGWQGHAVIISQEGLAGASRKVIRRLVESLRPAEVHVVYAARDLTKVIPGGWHTRMRNGHTESWQDYLAGARAGSARVWQAQDPRMTLRRWEGFVPREHISVITVPPSGTPPEVLWQRFSAVVGLDPSRYSLDVPNLNESLGSAETELLRRVNASVTGMDRDTYGRVVQAGLTRGILARRPGQQRYALPAEEHGWVKARADDIIRYLRDEGFAVTGDLDDLLPRSPDAAAPPPDEVDPDRALDAATDVIATLLTARQEKRRKRQPHARPTPSSTGQKAGQRVPRPLRAAARSGRRRYRRWRRRSSG